MDWLKMDWLNQRLSWSYRYLRSHLRFLPGVQQMAFIYHEDYNGHRDFSLNYHRARKIVDYLVYEGCILRTQLLVPRETTMAQLKAVHDMAYLSRLSEPAVAERIFGQGIAEEAIHTCVQQQRIMAGGTIRAARLAFFGPANLRRIVNLGGGFHHAYPEGGYAFCVFNDVAIAISHIRRHGFKKKVLIIDLDLHQGDGNKMIFANDPNVVVYSVHAEDWEKSVFPNCHDIALGPGIGDDAYLDAIQSTLPKIIRDFSPDIVFYLAGVDVASEDEIGDWRISHDAIFERDCFVHECVGKRKMVVLTAGGYGRDAWRHTARFLGYLSGNMKKPVASNNQRFLETMRHLSRVLTAGSLRGPQTGTEDIFSDMDDLELMGGPGIRTRLFDYYSKYGLECAFEQYGIFDHLKKIGFPSPCLKLELDHPNGQCLRLYANDSCQTLLIECILDEKKDSTGAFRLLWIEWLLLQNPTLAVSPSRPLLPGQTYPGLGCLYKIMGMFFMVCDRLHFDGIGFNPSHFHVCFIARGDGFFEKPEDEAHFRICQSLTSGVPLQCASQMLHDGLLYDESRPAFKWRPARMIIPISESLQKRFQASDYQNAVADFAQREMESLGRPRSRRYCPRNMLGQTN